MPACFKILTVDVHGLGPSHKQDLILRELNKLHLDFIFLQETHVSCAAQARKIERKWGGTIYWSFGSARSAGVALLYSPHFSGGITRFVHDADGRIINTLASIHSTTFNLVNIYAPNDPFARKTFFSISFHHFS